MKFTRASHSPTFLASWQNKTSGKDALLQHMRDITKDLEAFQLEIHGQLAASTAGQKSPHFFEDVNAVQALNNFKVELDQIRRILWFYIEEAKRGASGDYAQQPKHAHVTSGSMKPVLSAGAEETISGAVQESFFSRLDLVMDNYYMQEKKPVANIRLKRIGH